MSVTNLQDIHVIADCPDCDGAGRYEVDVPRPHASGFNEGYLDSEIVDCERCFGTGEVYAECVECSATLMASDGKDVDTCRECRENV